MRKLSTLPNSGGDTSDYPFGSIIDKATGIVGTPVIEATYSDFVQSLYRFFTVSGVVPNGQKENTTNGFQLFNAMQRILDPVGTIKMWPSLSSLPNGYVFCAGQTLNTSTYADLFAIIGYTFGGAGQNFSIPNFENDGSRFPVSKGQYLPIGSLGGESTHALTINEMPIHNHIIYGQDNSASATAAASNEVANIENPNTPAAIFTRNTSSVGSGYAHNNIPPYIAIGFIIKANY